MGAIKLIRHIQNERGVALMMVLIISSVALAVMSVLLYMLTIGTELSGGQKRYETAVEASDGGKEVVFEWIGQRGVPELGSYIGNTISKEISDDCMTDKLNTDTGDWGPGCDASLDMGIGITNSYDIEFSLGKYQVYAKIVNTIEGNSTKGSGLINTGVVRNKGEVSVMPVPYYYTIEVEARNAERPDSLAERAKLSILYKY